MNTFSTVALLALAAGNPFDLKPHVDEKFLDDAKAPALNRAVLRFARDHAGKQVGDGECATLPIEAIKKAGGKLRWDKDGEPIWGKLLATLKPGAVATDNILPGDILQLADVRFEGKSKFGPFFQTAPHHTSIVSKVEKGRLYVLHQNWGAKEKTRPVVGSVFLLEHLTRGTIRVYRPAPR